MTTAVLDRPVLTLNKHWVPITVTTVREVIGLVAKGSAVIIDPETYEIYNLETWNDMSKAKIDFEKVVIRSSKLSLLYLSGQDEN